VEGLIQLVVGKQGELVSQKGMRFVAVRTVLVLTLVMDGANMQVAVPYAQTFGERARILTEIVRMP
jgi:hypothetical protein